MIRVLIILPVLLTLAAPLAADPTLDGWRGYKFGMTVDQAYHVPGLDLSKKNTPRFTARTRELGRDAIVDLFIGPKGTLDTIGLHFSGYPGMNPGLTRAQCEEKYRGILRDAEAQYGAFGTRPFGPLPHTAVSTRAVPGGKSHYIYAAYTPHPLSGGSFTADAVRHYGPRFITVHMWDMTFAPGPGYCELSMAFVNPPS